MQKKHGKNDTSQNILKRGEIKVRENKKFFIEKKTDNFSTRALSKW